jgi:hypothetical protein
MGSDQGLRCGEEGAVEPLQMGEVLHRQAGRFPDSVESPPGMDDDRVAGQESYGVVSHPVNAPAQVGTKAPATGLGAGGVQLRLELASEIAAFLSDAEIVCGLGRFKYQEWGLVKRLIWGKF